MGEPWVWAEAFIDLIYPPICLDCRGTLENPANPFFCNLCWGKIQNIAGMVCPRCGKPLGANERLIKERCNRCQKISVYYDSARSVALYQNSIRKAIHDLKFKYKTKMVPFLGQMLVEYFIQHFNSDNFDYILPIPLHWTRKWFREFNQSELLANYMSSQVGLEVNLSLLKRSKYTRKQSTLKGRQKYKNIFDAFAVPNPKEVAGLKILLIDDVFTSGVTINEASRSLKNAGAKEVHVLTLTRAI